MSEMGIIRERSRGRRARRTLTVRALLLCQPDRTPFPVIILLATASKEDVAALQELAMFDILPKEQVSRPAVLQKIEAQLKPRRPGDGQEGH